MFRRESKQLISRDKTQSSRAGPSRADRTPSCGHDEVQREARLVCGRCLPARKDARRAQSPASVLGSVHPEIR